MRRTKEEAAETKAQIIACAAKLFRENGIAQTSVADVMKAAGLTHGGFYRHFGSKDELAVAAMDHAFGGTVQDVGSVFAQHEVAAERIRAFEDYYLSARHVANKAGGCPAAALAGEVSCANDQTRNVFSKGVNAMVAQLEENLDGDSLSKRQAALRSFATQLGAVVLARSTTADLADEILEACRTTDLVGEN
uniref:TetR/AcrR family transcriptional regulator n=1 Tax=uncultured Altererythrobacter sp. TaxID=500840 RepID=UPI00262E9FA8|nr:TetR/AcrR family transcriptional regulator [uncultured Altererythrobacter sp.]